MIYKTTDFEQFNRPSIDDAAGAPEPEPDFPEPQPTLGDYPSERVLVDLVELLQSLNTLGFMTWIGWTNSYLKEDNTRAYSVLVDIIETGKKAQNFSAIYTPQSFDTLHKLYDDVFAIYSQARG